ncbi:hypothetical protein CLV51_102651 [Chitinophaga niastensis]|uniref:Uncharacterized protein n=1 Tax=Chitinophaga niastensis TaxID=536980 RepID=A0A2P8HNK4_CHINA|nr:hypothetical protein CLV51_102651 [Chitinophaga niastensis]
MNRPILWLFSLLTKRYFKDISHKIHSYADIVKYLTNVATYTHFSSM